MYISSWGLVWENGHILLAEKKPGEKIGAGILTGPGGGVEPGETPEASLLRETDEEWGVALAAHSLNKIALIDYRVKGVIDFRVHCFSAHILIGRPHETARFKKPTLYAPDALPYDRMFEADRHWLPHALAGERFSALVDYRERAKGFLGISFAPLEA